MKLKKLAFLIDLDNCLIDSDGLKKSISEDFYLKLDKKHSVNFDEVYESARIPSGLVKISLVIKRLAKGLGHKNSKKVEAIFKNSDFEKYLFKDTLSVLKKLKKLGDITILSMGDTMFQKLKIEKSGMGKIIGKGNIIIVADKKTGIVKTIDNFTQKYATVVLIDDRADVLESAVRHKPSLVTVWTRRGRYENIKPDKRTSITFEVRHLSEIPLFMNNFLGKITTENSNDFYIVTKGVTDLQKTQLIKYTNSDSLIKKFTHDSERFSDVKMLNNWLTKDRVVYSLTDVRQNLAGIIWFSPKKMPGFRYTFAIRVYNKARGKNLAKKFMELAFSDFGDKKVWLDVSDDNVVAINLYERFGFKTILKDGGRRVMVLKS